MAIRTGIAASILLVTGFAMAPVAYASPPITAAIIAAGGACGPIDSHGENECVLSNIGFTLVSGEALTQTASTRRMACSGGWINAGTPILTDGHWFITTDAGADLGFIKKALAAQGVSSSVASYCP